VTVPDNRDFEELLEYLRRTRGFDFTGYKRTSLMRRVQRRMQMVAVASFNDYVNYLEVHPDEFIQLFNTLLINVTAFFRDSPTWEYIASDILPRILVRKESNAPIRAWSAGCATGEEAFSLAMLLAEALGLDDFRERVKIYATDLDEEALAHARLGMYSLRDVAVVPEALRDKYFEPNNGHFVLIKDLRRAVIFGRHDLIQDAPISRVDLLLCRNTLMYFNAEVQARILARFHFALQEGGFLCLGKAEMLLTQSNLFSAVDLRRRIFSKVTRVGLRDRLLVMSQSNNDEALGIFTPQARLREHAFDANLTAQVVIDLNGQIVLANERARAMFNLNNRDIGRPLRDLELSYRPVELRSRIEQVYTERRSVFEHEVEWTPPEGERIYLDVQLMPLSEPLGSLLGVSITFTDITHYRKLQEELEQTHQDLEMAYEELQATNEELETTNEELQSTVEELETTNEELQSTNEELETMNEELQSTNEELQTINDELHRRSDELNHANHFLAAILTSLRSGVAVLDREFLVLSWNRRAEDLWGLRSDEVQHHHFLNLDIGLSVSQLRQPIRDCLQGNLPFYEVILEATNRRGRRIHCRVGCTPLMGSRSEILGVIVLMEELQDGTG